MSKVKIVTDCFNCSNLRDYYLHGFSHICMAHKKCISKYGFNAKYGFHSLCPLPEADDFLEAYIDGVIKVKREVNDG